MEPNKEGQEPQKSPEEIIKDLEATVADLKPKADASSQNFERLKKIEQEKKDLEEKLKLKESGSSSEFDSAGLKKEIEERTNLRLAGHSPEEMEEIERYAKGAGISLSEAAKSPFVQKAVDGLRADKKSTENTPPPSSKIKVFKGKPVDEIFKTGTPAEKQEAFDARIRGGGKTNE